ncbi:TonB-dependent receptor plug domain-containing protein [Parabacteroides sp. APC149_11_2_Y6]
MNKTLLYIISFLLFLSLPILAQEADANKREQLLQASKEYQVGHIDKAIDMLTPYVSSYSGTMKVSAYKLLTLCYLAQDDAENANRYADLLLKEDPYYSISLQDPERFAELIRNKRDGKTTLVTASQQAETLEETPVPVVLITEEMIKAIGARDLRDVLTAYVPGITSIEGKQANISMHGIYSPTQEKILIMLNGHRMNSRITNAEAPDFRNSLDKIKRIEVLRGPASSLYGNVALTAVVNIITKSGSDINGAYASYGMGSNSTFKGDLLFGRRNLDTDILIWGSIYSSKGETRTIPSTDDNFLGFFPIDGSMQIDGFNHKPAYDFGVIFQWNKIKAMFNQQYSKRVPSYAYAVTIPSIYSYDKYSTFNGAKPGQGRLSTRGEISYSDSRNNFTWDVSLFIDADECSNYNVIGDSLPSFTIDGLAAIEASNDSLVFLTSGVFEIENWRDLSYGGCIKGSYSYRPGKKAHGNILVGVQLENYKMQEYINLTGGLFNQIKTNDSDDTDSQTLALGSEFSFSIFSQLKHHFNPKFIFNGGLRYDYKHRYDHQILQAFSPRLSFIYSINKIWNMKLGYSRSFVDAPYYYRASGMYLTDKLNPESMDAIQLSATALFKHLHLTYDCNLYYNQLKDIIHQGSYLYYNGKLNLIGLENILSYTGKNLMVTCNMSYQHVLSAEHYSSDKHQIYDIPSFSGNLIAAAKIFSLPHEQSFWLRGNLSVYSSQLSPILGSKDIDTMISLPDNKEKARAILNIGGSYHWKKLELSVQCYNLLNTYYRQGGSSLKHDIPQQGRSFIAKIAYTIQ